MSRVCLRRQANVCKRTIEGLNDLKYKEILQEAYKCSIVRIDGWHGEVIHSMNRCLGYFSIRG